MPRTGYLTPHNDKARVPIMKSPLAREGLLMPVAVGIFLLSSAGLVQGQSARLRTFTKQQLTDQFWSEGACFGDINRDGRTDVVAGPFWYEGPTFSIRHAYMDASRVSKSKKDGK